MIKSLKPGNYHKFITKYRYFFANIVKMEEKQVQVTVNNNNYNINYVKAGNGDRAVLLMPGALGTAWTDFKPQIDKLPKLLPDHSIIAWDPPGYGRSKPPDRDFSGNFFETDAIVAKHFVEKLNFKKFSILGWSDGGITGMLIAARYPDVIDKLVIWGANAYIIPDEVEIYENIRDVSKWSKGMREPMERVYGINGFPKLWSDWIDAMLNLYKMNNGNICKDKVQDIQAQTLILHGAKDSMVAAEHIPFLRKSIKSNLYYEFAEGKHNIHLRYSDEFNKIVCKFLLNAAI